MTCTSCNDVLGALLLPKVAAEDAKEDDVGLLRQRIILHLLRQMYPVPELSTTLFQLLQRGILTKDVISDVLDVKPRLMQLQDRPSDALDTNAPSPAPGSQPGALVPTRFLQDFQCKERLGVGSYGEVWHCQHRLDGQEYAVKKVVYRADGPRGPGVQERVLREAQTWALVNHPNIVRYHSCWVEADWETWGTTDARTETRQPLPLEDQESSMESGVSDLTEASDGGVVFLDAAQESTEPTGQQETSSVEEVQADAGILAKRPRETAGSSAVYKAILHIQTELCRKETLQNWISQRNAAVAAGKASKEDLKTWASQAAGIFRQVASALSALHARGLAHRDVKPTNILFGMDGGVRLGDFGLAKLLDAADDTSQPRLQRAASTGVGTPIYASPEQLATDSYSVKTDIFALGMILAELLCPVATQMERATLFERLRNGKGLPKDIAISFPKAAKLVEAMTQREAESRPCAEELLQAHEEIVGEVCEHLELDAEASMP